MIDVVTEIVKKAGKYGDYQSIKTAGGASFFNSKKPFPQEGDEIDYEINDKNGYKWTTKMSITVDVEPKVDKMYQLKLTELILKYNVDQVKEALNNAYEMMIND